MQIGTKVKFLLADLNTCYDFGIITKSSKANPEGWWPEYEGAADAVYYTVTSDYYKYLFGGDKLKYINNLELYLYF
jgi:hypothetical protein